MTHLFLISVFYSLFISSIFCVGAGAAYARAEREVKELVEVTGLPFLPTPMGKGVLPDDHPNCVAAARSRRVSKLFKYNYHFVIYCIVYIVHFYNQ